jgi:hypothetical protein
MRRLLFGIAVLPFLAGVTSAAQPLSDAQLETITAGASSFTLSPTILASWPVFLSPSLASLAVPPNSASSSSVAPAPSSSSSNLSSDLALGEAGLTGTARLGEFVGVVQYLTGH